MSKNWLSRLRYGVGALTAADRSGTTNGNEAVRLRTCLAEMAGRLNPDALLLDLRYVVIDTETTGFHPHRGDEVVALGAVTLEKGRPCCEKRFHRLVNPGRSIPAQVAVLTGITNEDVSEAEDLITVLQEFVPFMGDACLVGHNLGFDLEFINLKLSRFCGAAIGNPVLDTSLIARVLYPTLNSYSLDALLEVHGINPEGRHTAIGDAWLTARLFELQLELLDVTKMYRVRDMTNLLKQGAEVFLPGF